MLAAGMHSPSLICRLQNKRGLYERSMLAAVYLTPLKRKLKPLCMEQTLRTDPSRSQHQAPPHPSVEFVSRLIGIRKTPSN